MHVAFGDDISGQKFEFAMLQDRMGSTFVTQQVTLREALNEVNLQILESFIFKLKNPVALVYRIFGWRPPSLTPYQR